MIEQQPFASPQEALAHHGVKGMKWGVRRNQSSTSEKHGSMASVTATKTAQATVVLGSAAAGRVLGGALGTAIAPGIGTGVGQFVGGYAGGRLAAKALSKPGAHKREEALKDLAKAVPNRHAKYTDNMVKSDIKRWGPEAANRINDSMNSGKRRSDALWAERSLQDNSGLIAGGVAVTEVLLAGPVGRTAVNRFSNYTGSRAAANRASRAANNARANRVGLPAAPSLAKRRRGAYKIASI